MGYEIIQINANTWRIEDDGVRLFLLAGSEKALLIDSGMNLNNARDVAAGLTDLPLSLLNTHADRDHIGSNEQFDAFYMHPADEPVYRRSGKPGTIIPIREGDSLNLGDRELRIIHLPGHTPGSVCYIFDGLMFTGDTLFRNSIGRTDLGGDEEQLRRSLKALKNLPGDYDVYPGHDEPTTLSDERRNNPYLKNV
jgi:glyoxylase-like metal-dependent hydrolase (beta-lactamase superfamily II)